MHPWDDPANAPRDHDDSLLSPHEAVSPADAANFHDYQDRLRLLDLMQREEHLAFTDQRRRREEASGAEPSSPLGVDIEINGLEDVIRRRLPAMRVVNRALELASPSRIQLSVEQAARIREMLRDQASEGNLAVAVAGINELLSAAKAKHDRLCEQTADLESTRDRLANGPEPEEPKPPRFPHSLLRGSRQRFARERVDYANAIDSVPVRVSELSTQIGGLYRDIDKADRETKRIERALNFLQAH